MNDKPTEPLKRYTVHLDEHEDGEYYLVSDVQELLADKARLEQLCGFLRSCILSGEPWTESCDQMYDAAMKKGTP